MAEPLSSPPADAHIAACGLFCTNCGAFKKGKCAGCQIGPRYFRKCAVRACCAEKGITTCAECDEFGAPRDYRECAKLNTFVARVFSLFFGSDRPAALAMLRDRGRDIYIEEKLKSGKK